MVNHAVLDGRIVLHLWLNRRYTSTSLSGWDTGPECYYFPCFQSIHCLECCLRRCQSSCVPSRWCWSHVSPSACRWQSASLDDTTAVLSRLGCFTISIHYCRYQQWLLSIIWYPCTQWILQRTVHCGQKSSLPVRDREPSQLSEECGQSIPTRFPHGLFGDCRWFPHGQSTGTVRMESFSSQIQ